MKAMISTFHSAALRPLARAAGLLVLTAGLGLAQAQNAASAPACSGAASLDSNKDKISYATGVQAVRNFMKNDIAFDADQINRGMRDAMSGKDLAMSEKEIRQVLNALQVELRRTMAANQKELGEKNRKRSADYLAAYKAKPVYKDKAGFKDKTGFKGKPGFRDNAAFKGKPHRKGPRP